MNTPTELRKTEQDIAALCNAGRYTAATHLALWLTYLPLAGRVGDVALEADYLPLPPSGRADYDSVKPLQAFFAACTDHEAAFEALTRFCTELEAHNEVLRGTATGLLRYIPQDEGAFRHLQTALTLLRAYTEQQPDRGAALRFLAECLNSDLDGDAKAPSIDTAESVCRLFRALAPQAESDTRTVYDPCCGTGRLTAAVAQNALNTVFGKDISPAVQPYFLIRNLLAGNTYPWFFLGNAVTEPPSYSPTELQTFDLVVSQPPFGYTPEDTELAESDPYHRFERGLPRRNSGDWLHICNCLAHANKEHGTVMTLSTRSTLFRTDVSRDIRRDLTEKGIIDTIIVLPQGVLVGTIIAPALLIFSYKRRRKGVRLIDAQELGTKDRRTTVLSEADIERIRAAYESDADVPNFARTFSAEELAAQDYDWDVPYLLHPHPEVVPPPSHEDMAAEIARLRDDIAAKQARLAELLKKLH